MHSWVSWPCRQSTSCFRTRQQHRALRSAHSTICSVSAVPRFSRRLKLPSRASDGSRNRSTACPSSSPAATRLLRRTLEQWFDSEDVKPKIVGELDDSALSKVLGEAGYGIFAAPDVIEEDVRRRYKVQLVGRAEDLRQRFYAISVERKLKHPAVVAICEVARKHIFT